MATMCCWFGNHFGPYNVVCSPEEAFEASNAPECLKLEVTEDNKMIYVNSSYHATGGCWEYGPGDCPNSINNPFPCDPYVGAYRVDESLHASCTGFSVERYQMETNGITWRTASFAICDGSATLEVWGCVEKHILDDSAVATLVITIKGASGCRFMTKGNFTLTSGSQTINFSINLIAVPGEDTVILKNIVLEDGSTDGSLEYSSSIGSGTVGLPKCCQDDDIPFPEQEEGYEYSEPWIRGEGNRDDSVGYNTDHKCTFGPGYGEPDEYGFPVGPDTNTSCPDPLYVLADGTWICHPNPVDWSWYSIWNGFGTIEESSVDCVRYHRCRVRPLGECHPCTPQGGGGGGGGGGSNEIIPPEPAPVPPIPPIPGPMPGPTPPDPAPIYPVPPFPTEPGPGPIPGPGPNPGPYPEPDPGPDPIEPYPPGPTYPPLPPGPNIPPIPPDPIYPPSPDCCQEQTYIEYCKCMNKRTREFISGCGYMPKTFISWMDDYNERNM